MRARRLPTRDGYPPGLCHLQVALPERSGVDAQAVAVTWTGLGRTPDPDVAQAAVVRTWCGEDVGQLRVRDASACALASDLQTVLTLDELAVHDPALYGEAGCPLEVLTAYHSVPWVPATRYRVSVGGQSTLAGWVPYSQAVVRYPDGRPDHPIVHTMNLTGLGAGRTWSEATAAACADVLAQDAVIRWWCDARRPLEAVVPSRAISGSWGDSPLSLSLGRLPSATPYGVALAVVDDCEHDVVTLAARTSYDEAVAAALWQHICAVDLLEAGGDLHGQGITGLLAHRPGRDYLSAAGPGWRAALDPMAALQLGLDPEVVGALRRRSPAPVPPWHQQDGISHGIRDDFTDLLAGGFDVWVVDLTAPEAAAEGWSCVRVLVPGLARIPVPAFASPIGPTSLPYPGW